MSRRKAFAGVLGIMLIMACLATPAPASARTFLPNCQGLPRYKPKRVVLGCADFGFFVNNVQWLSWGPNKAIGTSADAEINDCAPNCASGTFHQYPVDLKLSRARFCPAHRDRQFHLISVTFVDNKPAGFPNTEKTPEHCAASRPRP